MSRIKFKTEAVGFVPAPRCKMAGEDAAVVPGKVRVVDCSLRRSMAKLIARTTAGTAVALKT